MVKTLDYDARGRGFKSHQLLPRKGTFLESLVSLPTGEGFNIGVRLPLVLDFWLKSVVS